MSSSAKAWQRRWCRDLLRVATPEALAALRIVVCALILATTFQGDPTRFAALPAELVAPPLGWGWTVSWLPLDPTRVGVAQAALVVAATLGLVGWRAQVSLTATTLLGSYVLGVPQLFGDAIHYHHLLWLAALLAASPCADRWSVDALRKPRTPRRARIYAIPLVIAWLLLATVYVFPGLHKLRASGLDWALSDNLTHLLHQKWWQRGEVAALRPDRMPGAMQLGGLGVLAFELAFPLLVLVGPRARAGLAVTGMVFHGLTSSLFHIHFPSLWLTYVILFDVRGWARDIRAHLPPSRRARDSRAEPRPPSRVGPSLLVGGAVLALAVTAGALGLRNAWPFACYPTFAQRHGPTVVVLRGVGIRADGSETELVRGGGTGPDAQRWWAITNSLVNGAPSDARLRAFAAELARRGSAAGREGELVAIRLERAEVAVAPERWSSPPLGATPLLTLALGAD